ncbi:uncharacterized protein VTP21DRAFT_597 [Calcarisporiella thermophila]|uniref:uncharacterized protein n=1 Tax=Calcarisporiella thermophila TaxID=911321 RepID=UPI0037444524
MSLLRSSHRWLRPIPSIALRSVLVTRAGERRYSQAQLKINTQEASKDSTVRSLYNELTHGDRYALSRAITLVESYREDHRLQSQQLLSLLLSSANTNPNRKPSFRIGISGSPGVGKSTFIEAFGMMLLEKGHKLAVLAVDPSSTRTGGSILGDKTRMTELSRQDNAYVRPSPSRGTLGGVARNTAEAILLCEAAGYDVTLVETVGVGQSETMVAEMVDMFVLLVPPAGGDELQGLKKGIVELSDLVIVNKADGTLIEPARRAAMEYTSALKLLKPTNEAWRPQVCQVSSMENNGLESAWGKMQEFYKIMSESGDLAKKRGEQRTLWMWRQITSGIIDRLHSDQPMKELVKTLEAEVFAGNMTSGEAAERVVEEFLHRKAS